MKHSQLEGKVEPEDPVHNILARLIKHRWVTIPVVIGVAIVGIATFTNALESLYDLATRVLADSDSEPQVATSPLGFEASEESRLQCVIPSTSVSDRVFEPFDRPIYRRFEIDRSTGGNFSSCNGDECIAVEVRPVEGTGGSPEFFVLVELPPLTTFPKARRFGIGSIPVEVGATAAVRTADFDFITEIEDVQFERVIVGTRIERGSNSQSIARFETPGSTLDLFGDRETGQIWFKASGGGGRVVVECN